MTKKIIAYAMILVFAFQLNVKADEGMWFLAFIGKNYEQMKKMGFKLTPKDIYDINHSSMKDAVVALDHGSCTAELVSPNGLLFTNHHCGYGEIQAHSSVEHDYLTNGFWAKSMDEELPNPGKTVTFLVRMEDVSERVNAALNDKMTEEEREMTIRKIAEQIEKEAIGDTHYEAQVRSLFKGNNFYLFVYETFKDVRLVGAPPSAIGKFGGDTDNWMWPRQTGDFSIFRVYTAPDGSPAEYSPDNVPLKPKHYFPISIKGVEKKDFAMTMGYPGSTSRYLTSWGVEEVMNNENAIRVEVRGAKQEIIKKYMDASDKTRIQYSSKYYRSTNYYKYSIEQNIALKKLDVIGQKQKLEAKFTKWVNKDDARKAKYGETFDLMKNAYADRNELDKYQNYWFEGIYLGPEVFGFGLRFRRLEMTIQKAGADAAKGEAENLKEQIKEYFKDYDPKVDKDVFVRLVGIYRNKVAKDYYPAFFELIDNEYGGDIQKFADKLYESSFLTDETRTLEFLDNLSLETMQSDLGYLASKTALDVYFKLMQANRPYDYQLGKGMRQWVAGYMEMEAEKNPKKLFYPDANSTIRLSYGKVGGYKANGKKFNYFTDMESLMAKEDPNNEEFIVPAKLKELYNKKDYGRYIDKDGKMHVCFITDNDITGGNSGSPVINGNGELIGIAFDGNSEAMSGDIFFDKKLQRCINVDIRYVLFIIDKYAGATNIIDELDIKE